MSLYLHECGLSAAHVGAVLATRNLVTIAAAPMWGSWGDVQGKHPTLFVMASMCVLVPAAAYLVEFEACTEYAVLQGHSGLAVFVATMCVLVAFQVPLNVFLDSSTVKLLEVGDGESRSNAYGLVRAWLSLGMGVASVAFGVLRDHAGGRQGRVLSGWGTALGLVVVFAVLTRRYALHWRAALGGGASRLDVKAAEGDGEAQQSFWAQAWEFASSFRVVLFLVVMVANGVGQATYDTFIVLYLNSLGAEQWVVGLSAAVGCFANVPLFLASAWLLRRLGSRVMIAVGMLTFAARAWFYSMLDEDNYLWVLAIQSMHGVTFSVMWAGAIELARELSPPRLRATSRALLGLAFTGVGGALGNYVGGELYDRFGARDMFLYKAMGVGGAGLVFVALEVVPHAVRGEEGEYVRVGG